MTIVFFFFEGVDLLRFFSLSFFLFLNQPHRIETIDPLFLHLALCFCHFSVTQGKEDARFGPSVERTATKKQEEAPLDKRKRQQEKKTMADLGNVSLEIDASTLDFLIEGCPRLRNVLVLRVLATPEEFAHLEAFKAKLLTKNPNAKVWFT